MRRQGAGAGACRGHRGGGYGSEGEGFDGGGRADDIFVCLFFGKIG